MKTFYFVKQPSPAPKAAGLLSSSVLLSSSSIDWLSAPPVRSPLLLSFTQLALGGPAPGRAAETRLHQFQMKHQHFLPLHQSTAPARSPRSLTAPLSVCVMRNGTVCVCVCVWVCVCVVRLCVLCVMRNGSVCESMVEAGRELGQR